jgi:DNA-binding transcriptional MerR regulator
VTAAHTAVGTGGVLRIGELAQRTGVTTRTLRYWEELGLLRPSGHRSGGERLYLIADLQELLGFSLAEVRVVLETEDVDALDRARSEFRWGDADSARRRVLLEEAVEANGRLLVRLDDTLARIRALRDERSAQGERLTELLAELDATTDPEEGAP